MISSIFKGWRWNSTSWGVDELIAWFYQCFRFTPETTDHAVHRTPLLISLHTDNTFWSHGLLLKYLFLRWSFYRTKAFGTKEEPKSHFLLFLCPVGTLLFCIITFWTLHSGVLGWESDLFLCSQSLINKAGFVVAMLGIVVFLIVCNMPHKAIAWICSHLHTKGIGTTLVFVSQSSFSGIILG